MHHVARAVDAAAHARHAFDKVRVELPAGGLQQRSAALLDAVTAQRLEIKIAPLLAQCLRCRRGETAAVREDAPEAGGVVQLALLHGGNVQLAAVKHRLKLLKREDAVDILVHLGQLELRLFGGAGTDEHGLCVGVKLLYALGDRRHGGHIVRDVLCKPRELLFHEADERGAAGAGEKAALGKLRRLGIGDHVRAQRRLDDLVEAERLNAGDDLTGLGIGELTDDGGCDDGIHPLAQAEHFYRVEYKRLVRDRAPRALVHARAAGDAFIVVDLDRAVLIHGDGTDLAGVLARALAVVYRAVGASLRAQTAVDALGFIYMRMVELIMRYRAAAAGVLTAVGDTAAAHVRDGIAAGRAVVTGDVDSFNDVGVILVPSRGELDAGGQYGALLIHAAAHSRHLAGDYLLGDVQKRSIKVALPCMLCDGAQDLVLQMLDLCIEFVHYTPPCFIYTRGS